MWGEEGRSEIIEKIDREGMGGVEVAMGKWNGRGK